MTNINFSNNMSKEDALLALSDGIRMTHSSFTEEEWIEQLYDGNFIFEDGVICSPDEFWTYREDCFENGWLVARSDNSIDNLT